MKKFFDHSKAAFVLEKNSSKSCNRSTTYKFSNFNDFIKACKYDLSEANLFNIPNNIIIPKNVKQKIKYDELTILPDYIWEQLGMEIPKIAYNNFQPSQLFIKTEENNYRISTKINPFEPNECGKIDYISDLHLDSKIPNGATTFQAIKIIDQLLHNIFLNSESNIQIFAGDISHDKLLYQLFVNMLSQFKGKKIIVLGNHEFWSFESIKKAKEFYKKITKNEENIIFLHNELLCIPVNGKVIKVSEKQLLEWSDIDKEAFNKNFDSYQYFILGGCGFSGFNSRVNANNSLYYKCLDYKIDKIESDKFDNIFNKVSLLSKNKSLIVITHTPYTDWHKGCLPTTNTNIFYVNGHTHSNRFEKVNNNYIYSDNQVYDTPINNTRFKTILFKKYFDYFYSYKDGIKEITYSEYLKFLRGKGIHTDLKPNEKYKLYLVRRNGYSMFIRESKKGDLCLMHKGQPQILPKKPIKYFYNNINYSIDNIKQPLIKFNDFLEEISKEIKRIGGTGSIHGQIIDIDYCNHLYINLIDKQITPYYAVNTTDKTVYPTISSLLKDKKRDLYDDYVKLINSNSLSTISSCKLPDIKEPMKYLDTDIYKTNKLFHKLDLNIYEKIIGFWVNPKQNFDNVLDIGSLQIKCNN